MDMQFTEEEKKEWLIHIWKDTQLNFTYKPETINNILISCYIHLIGMNKNYL